MAEKNKLDKNILLFSFFIFGILLIAGFASAESAGSSCTLGVSVISQDPYPATPGDYVKVVFQISGVDNSNCNGAWADLNLDYPFSLDDNSTLQVLDGSTWIQNYNNDWMIGYKLKVDKNAYDGDIPIELHYGYGSVGSNSYLVKSFNITMKDSRTNFDAVIQQVSGSQVSIAIANTGKYSANSVIVKIPQQDSFRATGTDGQMVGNLASGDYTLVGFMVSPTASRNMTRSSMQSTPQLKFDIYYTDNIGERRVVNMALPLNMAQGNFTMSSGSFSGGRVQAKKSTWSIWYTLLIIIAILILAFVIWKKREKLFGKHHKENKKNHDIPDWIKNARDKRK